MDNELINDIKRFLDNDKTPVSSEWLAAAQKKYPYFTLPALLYLRNNGIDDNDELLDKLAIASADRNALALTLGTDAKLFADFYPPEKPAVELDTDATIDKFLDSYGNTSQKEIDAISNAIFNPAPDYADILAAQDSGENDKGDSQHLTKEDELINSFIEQSKQKEFEAAPLPAHSHVEQQEVEEIADTPISEPSSYNDSMLSESLAKMYISRHKYDKALEIIENINLNFPEKSIYFADQIRFLRKLVTYQQFNKH